MKKSNSRVPAIACPHCRGKMVARSSEQITVCVRELRLNCDNDSCGASFVAQIALVRIVRASTIPNPEVRLPFSQALRSANDDHRVPANDTNGVFAAIDRIMSG